MVEGLEEAYGKGSFYISMNKWECKRDIEFFFPHLDALPVERTLALIKPPAMELGEKDGKTLEQCIEDEIAALGLFVVGKRTCMLTQDEAACLTTEYTGSSDRDAATKLLCAEPGCIAMCLEGRGAIGKLQLIAGPVTSDCWARAPTTLRAQWGTDSASNAVHASLDMECAEKELKALFPTGTLQLQRTLCIVKPDSIANLVAIKTEIEAAGFTVLKEKQTTLSEERAQEFYREFKDKPAFNALVKEACSGPCCAMVLCRVEAVAVWNQLMGDASVKDARKTRPGSIRARFGRDGQRNAVHGSESVKSAVHEIRFFFPDMGVDPVPDDNEIRDFLFRKSAKASMDLKSLSDAEATNFASDPTMQQLLSNGLIGLCQVKPKGLGAVSWLSSWLGDNNPNAPAAEPKPVFDPPERTKQFVEYGINQDGMPFVVEAPRGTAPAKPIMEMDAEAMKNEVAEPDLSSPPFVVFVAGGPGCGKGTNCTRLKEDFNLVHLSTGDLMRAEVAAETYLGGEIYKHQDTNRFLLDGFPRTVEQAQRFEREIAEVSFMLFLEASNDCMKARIMGRAQSNPGRVDDNEGTVVKRLKVF
eukprot:gb/GFBE01028772.1/.p1 GENE.gb/GFBE01028772.1/~~gb/GFBE01028772.1/.p1  ORF type:complete len:586 (+),score=181.62 gb/GFBE01028772.1/:1-1758(+)